MFFLFEDYNNLIFYQIFTKNTENITDDESIIYNLDSYDSKFKDDKYHIRKEFKICINENIITFVNLENEIINSFIFNTNLESINDINIKVFKNEYTKIENIPLFMDKDYEQIFYCSFQINKIKNNLFFVKQFDKKTFKINHFYISQNIITHF